MFASLRDVLPEGQRRLVLFGVLIGHWTDSSGENLGIGQVVPAFRLKEVIFQDEVRALLRQAESSRPDAYRMTPVGGAEETVGDDV